MKNRNINIIFSVILVLVVCATATVMVMSHRNDEKDADPVFAEMTTEEPTTRADGFYNENNDWNCYENGMLTQKDDFVFGTVNGEEAWWYVKDGKVDFSYNALLKRGENKWWYVENGKASEETEATAVLKVSEKFKDETESNVLSFHGNCQLTENSKKLLNEAVKKFEEKDYKVGFFVFELSSMQGFSYNADELIYSASTVKGPYVTSLVSADNSVLDREKSLINSTLKYSSNEDYVSLFLKHGNNSFVQWAEQSGCDFEIDISEIYHNITPRQLAQLWLGSYFFFESGETGKKLGNMFENPETSPIHSVLSEKYLTRSKAGWLSAGGIHVTNDAGIIYGGEKTYIISVMTTAPEDFSIVENLVEAIDEVFIGNVIE